MAQIFILLQHLTNRYAKCIDTQRLWKERKQKQVKHKSEGVVRRLLSCSIESCKHLTWTYQKICSCTVTTPVCSLLHTVAAGCYLLSSPPQGSFRLVTSRLASPSFASSRHTCCICFTNCTLGYWFIEQNKLYFKQNLFQKFFYFIFFFKLLKIHNLVFAFISLYLSHHDPNSAYYSTYIHIYCYSNTYYLLQFLSDTF